jgi:hypothetical protein
MKNTHVSIHAIRADRVAAEPTTKPSTAVHELFVELVQILERLKDSTEDSGGENRLERWEDDAFVYLQTDLNLIFESEIDINVHDGRFYVRLER